MVKAPNWVTEQLLFYMWQLSLADEAEESKDKYVRHMSAFGRGRPRKFQR